jgi:glycerol kinase
MAKEYVLALDQGTTSSRAIIFDRAGRVVEQLNREFPQHYPQPGWVEHDPEDIWQSQIGVARRVLAQRGLRAEDIAAIGITNQRETVIIWDRTTGKPIYPAIVWQDRRTAALCDRLRRDGWEGPIREKTGLVIDAYFSATKLRWILDHVEGAQQRAERGELLGGTVDSFLIWRLSGGRAHVTDASNASRTMLFNIHQCDWDGDLLAEFDIPGALLPEVRQSSEVLGQTDSTLFGGAISIAGDAGDQQAATFGQACFHPGMVKNTYGTGNFLLMNTGAGARESNHGLLTTIAWQIDGEVTYALEGSVFVTGAAVQWLRDGLGVIRDAAETAELAASVPNSGGVYLVPAFAGLGAPYWDQYARGTLVGLTRGTKAAHIIRASLEAAAFQSRDVLDAMRDDSGLPLSELRVDGGMVVNDVLLQIQADIAGTRVQRPLVHETTALGAAYLAGLAVGYWEGQAEIESLWQMEREFLPRMDEEMRQRMYTGWRRAVDRAMHWIEPEE